MRAPLPLSEIRSTNGLAGRLRRDVCAADPIVTAGVPTLSPRIPASDQRQEGQPARPVAAPSDLGLAMQPTDGAQSALLTQCAYAVETVMPVLRERDAAHQARCVEMGPSAVHALRRAKAFHVAVSNLVAVGELTERLALYPELLTVLQHLERGDSVRIAITANSTGTVTEFVGGGDVVAFAPVERVA